MPDADRPVLRFFPDSDADRMPRLHGRSFRSRRGGVERVLTVERVVRGIADDAIDDTRVGEAVEDWHCRLATAEEAAAVLAVEAAAEASTAERRAAAQAASAAWRETFVRLTAGLTPTLYGPRPLHVDDFLGAELLLCDAQVRLFRLGQHLVAYSATGVIEWWGRPEEVRAWRLAAARAMAISVERARRGVEAPHIGEDQRAVYRAVLDAYGAR